MKIGTNIRFDMQAVSAIEAALNYVPLDTLYLKERNCPRLASVVANCKSWTREKLEMEFRRSFVDGQRLEALCMSDELTRRGVPPYFRNFASPLPPLGSCNNDQQHDLLVYDLRWLVLRYPEHTPNARGYREIFIKGRFFHGVHHIAKRGYRENWKIVKDMRLTTGQQWECLVLRNSDISQARKRIRRRWPDYEEHFRTELADPHNSQTAEEKSTTCTRRLHIWVCSCIAGSDHPSKVADLYRRLTGEKISAAIVSRQIGLIPSKLRCSALRANRGNQ